MTLRSKTLLYLIAIHGILAIIAIFVLLQNPLWLFAIEVLFAASIYLGYRLVRAYFVPLELIRTGAELIRERDFTTQFRKVGQAEMDDLIEVYNRMIDRLREERLRLEEQNLFLDKLLRASPAGILILDLDGKVSLMNPSARELLSLSEEEVVGARLEQAPGPIAGELNAMAPETGKVLALQGGRRLRCWRGEFLDRGFGRSFFLLEEMTEELRASERAAYGKVIRMTSHEVNNSVGAVRSLLESCANYSHQLRQEDRGDFENALEVSAARLEHLSSFVNDYADVVRRPPPNAQPCDVRRLLDDIRTLLGPEMERRSIECGWATEETVAPIPMDENQMEQVLVNVLKNAMESIEESGRITLGLGRENGRPRLSIRDTGAGLPDDLQSRLFTPFFSTKRDGRGLGLTVTREILSQHRFDFGLRNHPDGGAEFWIGF
jgi:nitrogen fixation/metabolism regulation signal transduction histidine kinase